MFLKRCRRRKCGKDHVYWQLVESYRTSRGSRHRVVAYLGGLSKGERRGWTHLAATLDGKAATKVRQLTLLEPPCDDQERPGSGDDPVPETIQVKTKGVRVERTRDFGDVYLGLCLWRMLGLDDFFERGLPEGREEIPWHLAVCILAIARLVEPSSELHVEDTWYLKTALADLVGVPVERVTDSRLYRTLDRALPLKPKIEAHLKERIGELFSPDLDILLYDVTSTYLEGEAKKNPQAKRGYSRDHRGDCKQVCIGLVVTTDGFPLGYAGLRLRCRSVKKWRDWAELSEGCYLLRTNLSGKPPEELWRTYLQLAGVEEMFRTEKTELAIRPIWHQPEHRVQAHVLFWYQGGSAVYVVGMIERDGAVVKLVAAKAEAGPVDEAPR